MLVAAGGRPVEGRWLRSSRQWLGHQGYDGAMQLLVAASAAAHDASIPLDDPMNLFIIASSLVTALAFAGIAGAFVLTALGRAD